jgi:hypothetical protein
VDQGPAGRRELGRFRREGGGQISAVIATEKDAVDDVGLISGILHFVAFAALGVLVLSVTRVGRATRSFQLRLFLVAFVLRFAAAVVIYQFGLVQVLKDEDGSGWLAGKALCQEWEAKGVGLLDLPAALAPALDQHHRGYYYLLGLQFFVTGHPARLPAAALNCFLGSLIVVMTYRAALLVFSPAVAARTGWWTCLFPSLILWSAQTIKEPVVIFLETLALCGAIQFRMGQLNLRSSLLGVAAIFLLIPFRLYAAAVTAAAVAVSLALPVNMGSRGSMPVVRIGVILGLFLIGSVVLAQRQAGNERYDLQYLQSFRDGVATGQGSAVLSDNDLGSTGGFASSLLIGGVHLLLAPLPWQMLGGGSIRMLFVGPEMLVWWWLFFWGVVPGLIHSIRTRGSVILPVLLFLVSLGVFYSLTFGNIGLVYRQRAQLLPWLLMFAAVGLELRERLPRARKGRFHHLAAQRMAALNHVALHE